MCLCGGKESCSPIPCWRCVFSKKSDCPSPVCPMSPWLLVPNTFPPFPTLPLPPGPARTFAVSPAALRLRPHHPTSQQPPPGPRGRCRRPRGKAIGQRPPMGALRAAPLPTAQRADPLSADPLSPIPFRVAYPSPLPLSAGPSHRAPLRAFLASGTLPSSPLPPARSLRRGSSQPPPSVNGPPFPLPDAQGCRPSSQPQAGQPFSPSPGAPGRRWHRDTPGFPSVAAGLPPRFPARCRGWHPRPAARHCDKL